MRNPINWIVVLLVLVLAFVAWNPIVVPAWHAIGNGINWALAQAGYTRLEAAPEATPEAAPALTTEELDLLVEARCSNLGLTPGMEGWVYVDGVEHPCPAPAPAPIAPAVNDACYGVIDGSVVPYGSKVEFAASAVNTVEGPAVIEWWDGEGDAGHEGMFYVPQGQTLTLPRNVRGGYWQIVSSSAMTAEEGLAQLVRSHAHLVAFATKPQHAYATAALQEAYATCDWGNLEDLLVFLPEGATLK